ncbi:MAG: type II toxin-antitoxin system HicB family antitoxin [Roseburia sp.]|nr:type II toxin-antitoxin system HicB family antitoxin [Roseburia sp.]
MKKIEKYLGMPYKIELTPDMEEGGYAVSCPELPGCVSCGDTLEEAMANIEDAKLAWLTAAIEEGISIPEPENLDNYSGQFKLRMPKSLHKQLAEHSKREGISMNQYCIYLLAMNDARRTGNCV